jgi:predicted DsbA family dithiol-disulfide isomerase
VRADRLAARYDLDLAWVHFPLHPETPAEGITLEELFAGREADLAGMRARLEQLMEAEGLPYGDRSMTYNSRLAQELAAWAETQAGGSSIHEALFRAYFVDGENVSDRDVLVAIAEDLGLDAAEARQVLASRSFRGTVDEDWGRSRALGITAVPTFVIAGRGVVGAQPYEVLEQLVLAAGAEPRSAGTCSG